MVAQSGAVAGRRGEHGRGLTSKLILLSEAAGCPTSSQRASSSDFHPGVTRANNTILGLFGTPAGNVTVASGFAVGTSDLVIDVTGWRR